MQTQTETKLIHAGWRLHKELDCLWKRRGTGQNPPRVSPIFRENRTPLVADLKQANSLPNQVDLAVFSWTRIRKSKASKEFTCNVTAPASRFQLPASLHIARRHYRETLAAWDRFSAMRSNRCLSLSDARYAQYQGQSSKSQRRSESIENVTGADREVAVQYFLPLVQLLAFDFVAWICLA